MSRTRLGSAEPDFDEHFVCAWLHLRSWSAAHSKLLLEDVASGTLYPFEQSGNSRVILVEESGTFH